MTEIGPEAEVLEHGAPEAERRPTPRWVWGVLALVLVLAGLASVVDEHRRNGEDSALSSCRGQLVRAEQRAAMGLSGMADYLRPTLSGLTPGRAQRLAGPMSSPAGRAVPLVRTALTACQRIDVWAWHDTTRTRRDTTVAYADALLARLRRVAGDGAVYFQPDDQLTRLRARAALP